VSFWARTKYTSKTVKEHLISISKALLRSKTALLRKFSTSLMSLQNIFAFSLILLKFQNICLCSRVSTIIGLESKCYVIFQTFEDFRALVCSISNVQNTTKPHVRHWCTFGQLCSWVLPELWWLCLNLTRSQDVFRKINCEVTEKILYAFFSRPSYLIVLCFKLFFSGLASWGGNPLGVHLFLFLCIYI